MTEKEQRGKKFLSGVSYLTISALIVKVIGLFYRIPMLAYLGTEGMGYFNTAYEVYALLCLIATAGLPSAMSVLISADDRECQHHQARSIFRLSLGIFWMVGLVGSLLMLGLSQPLSALLKNQGAAQGMRMIAPTVLLICLSSAYRGYFQGKANMAPTAISQVIEALGKLCLGLLFAHLAKSRGESLPVVAGYAVFGLTVGTGISLVYLYIQKLIFDHANRQTYSIIPSHKQDNIHLLRQLCSIALPMTLSAMVMGGSKFVDLALILRRLQDGGMSSQAAASCYGCYSTLALPVFNMLPTLATSVALSVLPSLSSALGAGERESAKQMTYTALSLTLSVAIPASLGLSVFAKDILALLFAGQPTAVAEATPWLSCLALAVPSSCLITVTGAVLQAAHRAICPVIAMLGGITVKICLSYMLISNPAVGMMGAPIGTVVCDMVILLIHLYFLHQHTPWLLPTPKECIKLCFVPLGLSILSVGAVCAMIPYTPLATSNSLSTVASVLLVVCLYGGGWLGLWYKERRHRGKFNQT